MVRSSVFSHRIPRPVAILLSLLLAVCVIPLVAPPASAAVVVVDGFEIDGNLLKESAADDWSSVLQGPTLNDNDPTDTTVFSASSKEDSLPSAWTFAGSAPSKSDIGN